MNAVAPNHGGRWLAVLLAAGLLPWLFFYVQAGLNGNVTWLLTAADRMLAGEAMAETYFEVNPPLSIIYHLPPVALHRILPVPLHFLVVGYFLALIALSVFAFHRLTGYWEFLDNTQKQLLTAAYLIANTVLLPLAIGEREHIIILGLAPFMAMQLSLTWGYSLPGRLKWTVALACAPAALLKPHFGLLPTLLLVHRMVGQKRFVSIVKDPDFIGLAASSLLYLAVIFAFFADYVRVILPDVLALYVSNRHYDFALRMLLNHLFVFALVCGVDSIFSPLRGRQRQLLFLLYLGAFLSLVPVAVQMKSFYYHLLPALVFFFCGVGFSALAWLQKYRARGHCAAAIVVVLLLAGAYTFVPVPWAYPQYRDFSRLPLAAALAKCPKPCPVFIFNDSVEIVHPTLFYTGRQHASRFPSLWFLPKLIADPESRKTKAYIEKYAAFIAADLRRHKPELLLIGRYEHPPESGQIFDFIEFFSPSPAFRQELAAYTRERSISFDRRPYFAGTDLGEREEIKTYEVYVRRR